MEWFEKKFQGKVNEKISNGIALSQVELATKIEKLKNVLENIFSIAHQIVLPYTLHTRNELEDSEFGKKFENIWYVITTKPSSK